MNCYGFLLFSNKSKEKYYINKFIVPKDNSKQINETHL